MKPWETWGIDAIACVAVGEVKDGLSGKNTEGYDCCLRVAEFLKKESEETTNYEGQQVLSSNLLVPFHRMIGEPYNKGRELVQEMKFIALELKHVNELSERRQGELVPICEKLSAYLCAEQDKLFRPSHCDAA